MTFDEYQKQSRKTAIYPELGRNIVYPTLGLAGEAGEVAEKVKKIFRDDEGKVSEEKKRELKKELGDVLWYVAQLATELELSLDEIANSNIEKLQSRMARGHLHGSGDNR
ncbi:nucleoside triphosphate pyrophosphohydrolase family protein [Patescibacteria group bacterium]|nr:nucleoside triphosphate pyrophosphohydrolase family protein [Patescibacteria group bacterium]